MHIVQVVGRQKRHHAITKTIHLRGAAQHASALAIGHFHNAEGVAQGGRQGQATAVTDQATAQAQAGLLAAAAARAVTRTHRAIGMLVTGEGTGRVLAIGARGGQAVVEFVEQLAAGATVEGQASCDGAARGLIGPGPQTAVPTAQVQGHRGRQTHCVHVRPFIAEESASHSGKQTHAVQVDAIAQLVLFGGHGIAPAGLVHQPQAQAAKAIQSQPQADKVAALEGVKHQLRSVVGVAQARGGCGVELALVIRTGKQTQVAPSGADKVHAVGPAFFVGVVVEQVREQGVEVHATQGTTETGLQAEVAVVGTG